MLSELTDSQRFFYICTCITSFVGVPANIIAVIYLHIGEHAIHESTLLLYKAVATTDLVVALTVSKFSVQYLSNFQIAVTNAVACEVIEFALDTSMRLLYLLLCLLAVLRALVITFPYSNTLSRYRKITLRIIIISVLLLTGQSLVPVIVRHSRDDLDDCQIQLKTTFTDEKVYKAWRICTVFLQVTLAMVVMLLANAVSIHRLLKSRTARNCAKKNARNSAAITTVVLTMSFFFLHISGVVYMSLFTAGVKIEMDHFIANGISLLSPVVDPAVYFLRLASNCAGIRQTISDGSRQSRTQLTELVSRGSYRMSSFKLLANGSRKTSLCRSSSRSPPRFMGSVGTLSSKPGSKERLQRTVECQVEERLVECRGEDRLMECRAEYRLMENRVEERLIENGECDQTVTTV